MNREKQTPERTDDCSDQAGRRRLLKGIVATAPVVLSVTSRPVLAIRNCSQSGQLSGNNSGDTRLCEGEGCEANKWRNHLDDFHHEHPSSAIFDDVFGISLFGNAATLGQVINMRAKPLRKCGDNTKVRVKQFGKQAVAALQNAATEVRFDLTVADVILTVQQAYASAIAGKPDGKIGCNKLEETTSALKTLNRQDQNCPWW